MKKLFGDYRESNNLIDGYLYNKIANNDNHSYHMNWHVLIPAVKKCLKEDSPHKEDLKNALIECNILKVYKCVVDVINWYNKNIKT